MEKAASPACVVILALVVTACGAQTTTSPSATEAGSPGSSPAAQAGGELGTYTLGIFEDVTTDNVWSFNEIEAGTVWNQYLLLPTTAGAYTTAMPGIEYVPDLAATELEPTSQDGDSWV